MERELISLDELRATLEALARKNGRMEFAYEVAQWAGKHAGEIPPHIREELAALIVKAGE